MWFLEKVGKSVENLTKARNSGDCNPGGNAASGARRKTCAYSNVLTPDRIPEFFIPPKLLPLQDHSSGKDGGQPQAPRVECPYPYRDLIQAASLHVIQIENVDQDSSCPSEEEAEGRPPGTACLPGGEIVYLPESPHTRRKESLFHIHSPRHSDPPRVESLGGSLSLDVRTPREPSPDLRPLRSFPNSRTLDAMDSDTGSSTESSPFSSPLLTRSLAGALVCRVYKHRKLFARRSNLKGMVRTSSLSTDECSSADNSPAATRRLEALSSRASCSLAPPAPAYPLDFICCQERLTKECAVLLDKGGTLWLSAEYIPESRRLRVRVVSGEGLYPASFQSKDVSCCVVLCLLPGVAQKQRSTIIKKTKNPIFNEDFFFEGVTEKDLELKTMKVKVLNKASGMKRDWVMGENQLDLRSILPNLHHLSRRW